MEAIHHEMAIQVGMAQASASFKPSLVVVLLLWFSYHVFLSSAVYFDPPFTATSMGNIGKYTSLPPLTEIWRKIFDTAATVDPVSKVLDKYYPVITENSQPNPIAGEFPDLDTGLMNGTHAILPIGYELARSIIPRKYGILRAGIHKFLPSWPQDQYPLFLSAGMIHDVRGPRDARISDYSYVEFRFPFVDLLGDGYSHFSYMPSVFISGNPTLAKLAKVLDQEAVVATFQPPEDPYAFVPADNANQAGSYFFNAYVNDESVLNMTYTSRYAPRYSTNAYPLNLYANITNQPAFYCKSADCDLACLSLMTLFFTEVSEGEFAPRTVRGSVSLADSTLSGISVFPDGLDFEGVDGIKTALAFISTGIANCSEFKGYEYEYDRRYDREYDPEDDYEYE